MHALHTRFTIPRGHQAQEVVVLLLSGVDASGPQFVGHALVSEPDNIFTAVEAAALSVKGVQTSSPCTHHEQYTANPVLFIT